MYMYCIYTKGIHASMQYSFLPPFSGYSTGCQLVAVMHHVMWYNVPTNGREEKEH